MKNLKILNVLLVVLVCGCFQGQYYNETIDLDFSTSNIVKIDLIEKRNSWTERLLITVDEVPCNLMYEYFSDGVTRSGYKKRLKKGDQNVKIYDTEWYEEDLSIHFTGDENCAYSKMEISYKYY